jgi:hypothetical protein
VIFFTFFTLFSLLIKAKRRLNALYSGMKHNRKLSSNVWYWVSTEVNSGEPLFQLPWAKALLFRALRETKRLFPFEMRGLTLDGATVSFHIKPENGFDLPVIMQLVKQTFSLRFNILTGRKGHVWGERYESEILDGEPPAEAGEVDWMALGAEAGKAAAAALIYALTWDSLRLPGITLSARSERENPPGAASSPG